MTSKKELISEARLYLEQLREEGVEYLLEAKAPPRTWALDHSSLQALRRLEEKARTCRRCRLSQQRKHAVFGTGGMKKGVLFIGEGPGANEDQQGIPFVGRAGKLLDRMLASIGLRREDVYITNIVKCRPPGNRDPKTDEVNACWPYLSRQLELLKPRVIVTLGSPAAKTLLETGQGISRLRGRFHDYEGIPLLPLYHPAYLLRSYTEENRRRAWNDMKMLRDFLNADPAATS
jgi:DNA polymerase